MTASSRWRPSILCGLSSGYLELEGLQRLWLLKQKPGCWRGSGLSAGLKDILTNKTQEEKAGLTSGIGQKLRSFLKSKDFISMAEDAVVVKGVIGSGLENRPELLRALDIF